MNFKNISKREFITTGLIAASAIPLYSNAAANKNLKTIKAISDLEKFSKGRIGVSIYNVNTKKSVGYRENERFAMCSTFKFALAAVIMREIDMGFYSYNDLIDIESNGLKPYSDHVKSALKIGKISIYDALKAIQVNSDNICANGLLKILGGPEVFTKKIRLLGDNVTRMDRAEPEMNLAFEKDIRDTTTPLAFAKTAANLIFTDYLKPQTRETLKNWTIETKTGIKRLRAGLSKDLIIGNKTGTGISENKPNKYNDVAIIYGPNKTQFIISAYFESDKYYKIMRDEDQNILKQIGKIAQELIGK